MMITTVHAYTSSQTLIDTPMRKRRRGRAAHSAIVDAESTTVLRRRAVKIVAWYDNEWGYAARLIDLARLIARAQGGTS
jgi:glyceraldehyde-3-phosphate dehydrogenase/erythrose-4-phosphate dehydrogenase